MTVRPSAPMNRRIEKNGVPIRDMGCEKMREFKKPDLLVVIHEKRLDVLFIRKNSGIKALWSGLIALRHSMIRPAQQYPYCCPSVRPPV